MNHQEAKFILGACRPDGRDAGDPMFADALAQAETDPGLRAWLEGQRRFDAAVAGKLQHIAPPAELRATILAGGRASRSRRHWWSNPSVLAAAAALILLGAVAAVLAPTLRRPSGSELATLALNDLATAHDRHVGHPSGLTEVQARLAAVSQPLRNGFGIDTEEMRRRNCRTVRLAGRDVLEICFPRDGTWYHLYVAPRREFAAGSLDPEVLMVSRGEYASTAWADSKNVYALVTRAGPDALRRLF